MMRLISKLTIDEISRICHEANRAYCIVNDDSVLPSWDELTEDYRKSTRIGVQGVLHGNTPEKSHESWMKERVNQGWKFGEKLDRESKIHPNLIPYEQLPENQKVKNKLFISIVKILTGMD